MNSAKWTKTSENSIVAHYTNDQLPDVIIAHATRTGRYAVIDQDGGNHGYYDSLDEAAGIAKHLA